MRVRSRLMAAWAVNVVLISIRHRLLIGVNFMMISYWHGSINCILFSK
ncbi:Uncharacterised protein [Enterobacter cloacae]|nr:Uncharacterised protein [Enterobacter cloacae]